VQQKPNSQLKVFGAFTRQFFMTSQGRPPAAAINRSRSPALALKAIKLMRRDNVEGTIVNICSMSAKACQPFITAYCASKGALATLTQNVAYSVLRNRMRQRPQRRLDGE
jgi:NAD(P)-dependent dehydrogenase (short-subunit alcohol dehydrogenase family)